MKKTLFLLLFFTLHSSLFTPIYAQWMRIYKGGQNTYTVEKADSIVFSKDYHESEPATPSEEGYYVIDRAWDEHAEVVMESNIEKGEEGEELFCQSVKGEIVFFRIYTDTGYDWTATVTGKNTGKTYTYKWYEADDEANRIGLASWGFTMPAEPVVIKATSVARTTYEGKGFVGDYYAFMIPAKSTDGYLVRPSKGWGQSTIKLMANGRFEITSPDLIYDEEAGGTTFHYGDTHIGAYEASDDNKEIIYNDKDSLSRDASTKWGLKGYWYGSDDMMAYGLFLDDKSINSTHHYFASKQRFEYVCIPQDVYGTRYVLEVKKPNTRQWFYYYPETYKFEELTTDELTSDQSINNYCDVEFSNADGKYIRLINKPSGSTFRFKTAEAGTYTNADNNADLVLDGFGRGQWGDDKGEYTVDGLFVYLTHEKDGLEQIFTINKEAKTYVLGKDLSWNGPLKWSQEISEESEGAKWDNENTQAVIDIWLDHDYSGNVKEGFAKIKVDAYRKGYGDWRNGVIAATVSYTYDPSTQQLTLLQVPMTWSSSYKEDVILTYKDGKLYGKDGEMLCFGYQRYIDEGKIELKASEE